MNTAKKAIEHKHEEWSGSPCPEQPDECWVDDETGEHVNAETCERTAKHA